MTVGRKGKPDPAVVMANLMTGTCVWRVLPDGSTQIIDPCDFFSRSDPKPAENARLASEKP